jgi:hypothetical protein
MLSITLIPFTSIEQKVTNWFYDYNKKS